MVSTVVSAGSCQLVGVCGCSLADILKILLLCVRVCGVRVCVGGVCVWVGGVCVWVGGCMDMYVVC